MHRRNNKLRNRSSLSVITFSRDTRAAMTEADPTAQVDVVAIVRDPHAAQQPGVLSVIRQDVRADYVATPALLTEHGTDTTVEVVLHGKADAKTLDDAGFTYATEIADLAAKSKKNRTADKAYAQTTPRSALPSGRDT